MNTNELSSTQLRGYQVMKALFGHEIDGISCQRIADGLGIKKVAVLRDLQTLQAAGLAEQLPNKGWRITAALGREAIKMLNNLNAARDRVDEVLNRYTPR
ncbi:MAG: HTH domain-containing protein [Cardiobacteriaceae bacterium]|nr:HTH domain-containing protein [Cardiobacteriaceae bacterium]